MTINCVHDMNMNENDKKKVENVNPYCEGSAKGEQVEEMFDSIGSSLRFHEHCHDFRAPSVLAR